MLFLIRISGPKESSAIALHPLAKKKDSALMRKFGVSNTRIAWSINNRNHENGIVSIRNTAANGGLKIRIWPGGTVNSRVSACDGIVKTSCLTKASRY